MVVHEVVMSRMGTFLVIWFSTLLLILMWNIECVDNLFIQTYSNDSCAKRKKQRL